MEWTEKAAVAVDTPVPQEPGTEQQLVRGKNIQTTSALLSSDITGWEESIKTFKNLGL